jgi:mannosyltransferase OCH1-like enzyme
MIIPKIFHYVWLGTAPMHPVMVEWRERFAEMHPGWTIKFWKEVPGLPQHLLVCDGEIVECRNPAYLAQCPTYAKRSDVWRYDILEQQGGVYLDTDFEPIKNLEPILDDKKAFAGLCKTKFAWDSLNPEGFVKLEVGCSIMGNVPHHPWLQCLVERTPKQSTLDPLSLAFPYITKVTFEFPEVHLFSPETFYPYTWQEYNNKGKRGRLKEVLPEDTYAVHRWSSNWFNEGLKPRL